MRLRASKDAEAVHSKNMKEIQRLIKRFEDPNISPDEKEKLKKKFQQIIDHADKIQQQDSMFFRLAKKINENGRQHD